MPSRMIHYLIAEKVAEQVKMENRNRFVLGSLCPDMSCREDGSKNRTHYLEVHGDKKGGNWLTFMSRYGDKMKQDGGVTSSCYVRNIYNASSNSSSL